MKQYAVLRNVARGVYFGIVVKNAGVNTYYGWSDKGIEWSKWANQNTAGLTDLPIDVSVGEFKNLPEELFQKIIVDTKDVVAVASGLTKSNNSHVLVDSQRFANASRFPAITSHRLPSQPWQKRVSLNYKVKNFKQTVAKSEIAFRVRVNELAFNNRTKQFNIKPNRASQLAERHDIRSKMSRGIERQFGEQITKVVNKQILADQNLVLVKRDHVGKTTKEIVDVFVKGRLGYSIGRAVRGAIPNRRSGGKMRRLASRVIEGVLDPRKRRDLDGDGMIFDGTWREMPDPTRFLPDAKKPSVDAIRKNRDTIQGAFRRAQGLRSATQAAPDGPGGPPRTATARLMRMDPKNSSLAREITYNPQNGDLTVTYRDGRTELFKDVIYERARKAGFDDKPDDLIRELEREQNKLPSNPIGKLRNKKPVNKPKIVSRTSLVDRNKNSGLKSSSKLTLGEAIDIMQDLESPGVPLDPTRDFQSAFEKIWPGNNRDEWGDLISSVSAKLRTSILGDEFKKNPDAVIKKLVEGTALDIGTRSGARYDAASLAKLSEFISGVNSGKDMDATDVIASYDPKSPKTSRANALEAAIAFGLGKFANDPRARVRYQEGRGRKARLGSVIDDILGAAEGANEPDLERSLNKVKKGISLSPEEAKDIIPTLEDIAKNNDDFDGDDRLRDLINEVKDMTRSGPKSQTDKYQGLINDLQQAAEGTNEPQFVNALKKLESGKPLSDKERASLLESLKDVAKNNDDFDGDGRLSDLINDIKKGPPKDGGLASTTRSRDGWSANSDGRSWEFDGNDNHRYFIDQDDDGEFGVRSEQSLPSFDGEPNWKDMDYPETFDSLEDAKRFVNRLDSTRGLGSSTSRDRLSDKEMRKAATDKVNDLLGQLEGFDDPDWEYDDDIDDVARRWAAQNVDEPYVYAMVRDMQQDFALEDGAEADNKANFLKGVLNALDREEDRKYEKDFVPEKIDMTDMTPEEREANRPSNVSEAEYRRRTQREVARRERREDTTGFSSRTGRMGLPGGGGFGVGSREEREEAGKRARELDKDVARLKEILSGSKVPNFDSALSGLKKIDKNEIRGLRSTTDKTPKLTSWKPAYLEVPGVKDAPLGPDLSDVDFDSLTDDQLKTLIHLFDELNNRPFATPGSISPWWRSGNDEYLKDIKRVLRKRGYKIELSKTREPNYFGDYSAGDRTWQVYKEGDDSSIIFASTISDNLQERLRDSYRELEKKRRGERRGGGLRSTTDNSDTEDAINAITKLKRGEKLNPDEKQKAINALRLLRDPSKGLDEDERIELIDLENSIIGGLKSSTDTGSDIDDAVEAIMKLKRGEKLSDDEKKKALNALKLTRDKDLDEDERIGVMDMEKLIQSGGLKSSTDGSDTDDAIQAIMKVRRGEKLTPDEKQKALNALRIARSPEKGLDEDDRVGIMDMEKQIENASLASRTTGKSTRRPIKQSLTQRMSVATTERASRPRGLASTTETPDVRSDAPKAGDPDTPKKKRRTRLIIDMLDNFGKTKGEGDGVLWESMNDEQKAKAKDAIAAQKKVLSDRLKTKVFKSWWTAAQQGSDKETIRAVKKRARGEGGGTYKGRPADDPLTKDDIQDMLVVLDDAVRKGKIKKYKLNEDGTVKTDKNGQPIMTEAYSRAARDLDDLLTILNMEEDDNFSNLEHFHTGTRAAIHKNVGTGATGKFKMGDSSIAKQAGGMDKAKTVDELTDEDLGKAKKLSIGRRLLRVNEKRAAKARQRALRRTGSFRKGRIINVGDPELEMKRARLRARALKRTMLSKFRKSRDADELSRDMSKKKASLSPILIDNDGKVNVTPRYVSVLAKLDDDLTKARSSEDKVFDQVLADVWVNSGYSGEPVLVTEDEVRRLVAAGWQPIIRGTGSQDVLSEAYVEQFLSDESEARFIPGQGSRAFGVGEYFAFPGQHWSGYRGSGDQRHTMLVLVPPSADVVTVGELTRERDKMRDLTSRAVDATKALGGRDAADALTPGELAETYRKALPGLEGETSRSGQIVRQLVERLEELDKAPSSDATNKEKKEILRAFDYLSRFTRQKDVGYFAPLIGVDGIDTNDGSGVSNPFLLHNRANVAAFQRPMTSEEAENMAKTEGGAPVGSVWRSWRTRPDRSREGSPIEERKRVLIGGRRRRVSTRRPGSDGGDAGSPSDTEAPKPPTQTPATPISKSAVNTDSWTKSNPPTVGSNPATMLTDPNGTKYYTKLKKNSESVAEATERMETEVLAGKLYELAGAPVADLQMGTNNGQPVMLYRMVQTRMPSTPSDKQAARSHFVVDAWLANWDAPLNDNIKIDNNGRAVRLDVGGSLDYRAQGQKKGSGGSMGFGNSVGEMTSLQKSGNVDFTNMDKGELKKQTQRLGAITDDQIRKTVSAIVGDPARAKVLADTLIARRDDIIKRYG